MLKTKPIFPLLRIQQFFPALVMLLLAAPSTILHAQQSVLSDSDNSVIVEENSEEIVVSASRVPVPAEQVGSAVSVIEKEDIDARNFTFTHSLLREIPGVAVSQSGSFGGLTSVRIRGAEADHTLIRIDGIDMGNPASANEFPLQHLPASFIGRIEVLRGPQSSIYGSEAAGGVVDITTATPELGTESTANVEFGSRDTTNAGVYFGATADDSYFVLSASQLKTNGYSELTDNNENDAFNNQLLTTKFGANLSENSAFSVVALRSNSDSEYDGCGFPASNDCFSEDRKIALSTKLNTEHFGGMFAQSFRITDTHHRRKDFMDGSFNTKSLGKKREIEYQGTIEWDSLDFDQITIIALEHEEAEAQSSGFASDGILKFHNYTLEHRLGFENGFLSLSARREEDTKDLFQSDTTYRGTGALTLNDQLKLRVSYGTGVRNPTITDIFGWTNSWNPNPNLLPETSKGWDIGIDGQFDDFQTSFSATYFENRITNLIISVCDENCDDSDYNNDVFRSDNTPGVSKIKGLEVSAHRMFNKDFEVSASMTFSQGFDADENELLRRPHTLIGLNMNRKVNIHQIIGDINLNVQHTGSQRDTVWPNHIDLDAYTLVNLSSTFELFPNLVVTGRIANLTNEKYEEVYGYGVEPRSYYLGTQYKF